MLMAYPSLMDQLAPDSTYGHLLQPDTSKTTSTIPDMHALARTTSKLGFTDCLHLWERTISATLETLGQGIAKVCIMPLTLYGMARDVALTAVAVNSMVLHGSRLICHTPPMTTLS